MQENALPISFTRTVSDESRPSTILTHTRAGGAARRSSYSSCATCWSTFRAFDVSSTTVKPRPGFYGFHAFHCQYTHENMIALTKDKKNGAGVLVMYNYYYRGVGR